jgi:hypothetical protein
LSWHFASLSTAGTVRFDPSERHIAGSPQAKRPALGTFATLRRPSARVSTGLREIENDLWLVGVASVTAQSVIRVFKPDKNFFMIVSIRLMDL